LFAIADAVGLLCFGVGVPCVESGCCGVVCAVPGCGGLGFAAGGDARIADGLFGSAGGASSIAGTAGTALAPPAFAWLLGFAACSSLCCSDLIRARWVDGAGFGGAGFGGDGIVALAGGDCNFGAAGGSFGAVGVGGSSGGLWVIPNGIAGAAGFATAGSALGVGAAVCFPSLLVDSWGVLLLAASACKFDAGLPSESSPKMSSVVVGAGSVDGGVGSSVLTVGLAALGLGMLGMGCFGVSEGGGPGGGSCLALIIKRGGGIEGAAVPVFALLAGWEITPCSNSRFTGTLGPDFVAV